MHDDDGNSSFISGVFDFVSRELNLFVANATGAAVARVRLQFYSYLTTLGTDRVVASTTKGLRTTE